MKKSSQQISPNKHTLTLACYIKRLLLYRKGKVILFCTLLQCSRVDIIMTKDPFIFRSVSDILFCHICYIKQYKMIGEELLLFVESHSCLPLAALVKQVNPGLYESD